MSDLRECPFCGDRHLIVYISGGQNWESGDFEFKSKIICDSCKASAPRDVWNIRANEPIPYRVTPAGKAALRGES